MRWLGMCLVPTSGTVEAECPCCSTSQRMRRHDVLPRWAGALALFPASEMLVCPACRGVARHATALDRGVRALLLAPVLVLLAAAVASGIYLLCAMFVAHSFSGRGMAAALALVGAGGYLGSKAMRLFQRLLKPQKMLPVRGIGAGC